MNSHLKNIRLCEENLRKKNKIRDKFKSTRLKSITPAQAVLFRALGPLSKEYEFKVVKEREIYTKNGVRFADLFIKKYGLIIEVDGGYHSTAEQKEKDLQRDKEIWDKKRILTLRVNNQEILKNIDETLNTIRSVLLRLSTLSNYKSPGKRKKLETTLARKKIFNDIKKNKVLLGAQVASN